MNPWNINKGHLKCRFSGSLHWCYWCPKYMIYETSIIMTITVAGKLMNTKLFCACVKTLRYNLCKYGVMQEGRNIEAVGQI